MVLAAGCIRRVAEKEIPSQRRARSLPLVESSGTGQAVRYIPFCHSPKSGSAGASGSIGAADSAFVAQEFRKNLKITIQVFRVPPVRLLAGILICPADKNLTGAFRMTQMAHAAFRNAKPETPASDEEFFKTNMPQPPLRRAASRGCRCLARGI